MSFIIEIMAENGYGIAELFLYFLNKGALAGAGTPCNSYYNYVFHIALLFILAKNASAAGCLRVFSLYPHRRKRKNSLLYSQRIKLTRLIGFNVLKQSLILTAHMAQACLPLQTALAKSFETSKADCCHKQIFSKELNMAPVGVLSEPFDRARLHSRRKRAKTLVIKLHRSSTNGARLQFYPKSARGLAMNCEGDG